MFVNLLSPITGAPALTRLLTRDLEDYLGARFMINPSPQGAADLIEKVLITKLN